MLPRNDPDRIQPDRHDRGGLLGPVEGVGADHHGRAADDDRAGVGPVSAQLPGVIRLRGHPRADVGFEGFGQVTGVSGHGFPRFVEGPGVGGNAARRVQRFATEVGYGADGDPAHRGVVLAVGRQLREVEFGGVVQARQVGEYVLNAAVDPYLRRSDQRGFHQASVLLLLQRGCDFQWVGGGSGVLVYGLVVAVHGRVDSRSIAWIAAAMRVGVSGCCSAVAPHRMMQPYGLVGGAGPTVTAVFSGPPVPWLRRPSSSTMAASGRLVEFGLRHGLSSPSGSLDWARLRCAAASERAQCDDEYYRHVLQVWALQVSSACDLGP